MRVVSCVFAGLIAAAVVATAAQNAPIDVSALPIELVWTKQVDGPAPLAAAAGTQFVAAWGDRVTIYDISSGEPLASLTVPATRIACDGSRCIATGLNSVTALDLETRAVAWQQPVAGAPVFSATLRSGWALVTSAAGDITAFRDSDGRVMWNFPAHAALAAPPVIDGPFVAAATVSNTVLVIDILTGRALRSTGTEAAPVSLGMAGGDVLVGTERRDLLVLAADTNRLRFPLRTAANLIGAPSIDEKNIYTTGQDGVLRAFDRANGAQRWYSDLATRPSGGPVVSGGLVVVPLGTGAFDVRTNDGKSALSIAPPSTAASSRLPATPIVISAKGLLETIAMSFDFNDQSHWTMIAHRTAPPLTTSQMPAVLPGLDVLKAVKALEAIKLLGTPIKK